MRAAAAAALLVGLYAGCGVERPVVAPPRPTVFVNLSYRPAQERYRQRMEERYQRQDLSYLISLLDYAQASYYARDRAAARQGFTAAYKVDDGNMPEATKFFNWLQEDARKVYRLEKRERELVHFYLALNYLFENDLEAAQVEFKKLRLRDMDASELPAVEFYHGLVCELAGQYDDARIAYRRLAEMGGRGRHAAVDGELLAAMAESLAAGSYRPSPDSVELVLQVDHLFAGSTGPTEVWADDELVAVLPGVVDPFEVKLTPEEASRKAAQAATAEATRQGLRLLGKVLGKVLLNDARVGDLAADLTFGGREDREDARYWGYAPAAFGFGRVRVPATAREVRLEFSGPGGGRLGSCRYPLAGEHARVERAGRAVFVVAGLAREFYEYQ
jgi:tetratricopeptide (TPR) repeat protein